MSVEGNCQMALLMEKGTLLQTMEAVAHHGMQWVARQCGEVIRIGAPPRLTMKLGSFRMLLKDRDQLYISNGCRVFNFATTDGKIRIQTCSLLEIGDTTIDLHQ